MSKCDLLQIVDAGAGSGGNYCDYPAHAQLNGAVVSLYVCISLMTPAQCPVVPVTAPLVQCGTELGARQT